MPQSDPHHKELMSQSKSCYKVTKVTKRPMSKNHPWHKATHEVRCCKATHITKHPISMHNKAFHIILFFSQMIRKSVLCYLHLPVYWGGKMTWKRCAHLAARFHTLDALLCGTLWAMCHFVTWVALWHGPFPFVIWVALWHVSLCNTYLSGLLCDMGRFVTWLYGLLGISVTNFMYRIQYDSYCVRCMIHDNFMWLVMLMKF